MSIFEAFIGEQFEHEYVKRVDRALWHGQDAMEVECMEPQCPCGTSVTEGPVKPSQMKGILQ